MRTMTEWYAILETEYANRIAYQWYDETTESVVQKSYAEFTSDIRSAVNNIRDLYGDVAGKHIALLGQNDYWNVVKIWAICLSGGVLVPLNAKDEMHILLNQIQYADVDYVFHDNSYLEQNPTFAGQCKNLCSACGLFNPNIHSLPFSERRMDQLSMLIFTSGTTGKQKCVSLSLKNVLSIMDKPAWLEIIASINNRRNDSTTSFFHMFPHYHSGGIAGLLLFATAGYTINLCPNPKYFVRDITAMPSHIVAAVPMMLRVWHTALVGGHADFLSAVKIVIVGGAFSDPAHIEAFNNAGIAMIHGYGQTESSTAGIFNSVMESCNYKSVGKVCSALKLHFDNGEICFSGEPVAMGYYKNEEDTAETFQDGWLHTGDIGYIDEKGYVYLTGRKKNLIITENGENVSPEPLEELVLAHPLVKEVVVCGKHNRICAEIYCETESREEIRAYIVNCNKTLPIFKRMTAVEFRAEAFPKTSSGKIKRN